MGLNKSKGNMYNWCSHTWNVIKGKCPHQCSYCYCKRWGKQSPLHFDEKELKTDLGSGNTIFVGSSCDMWASRISAVWIKDILIHCQQYRNRYLFQTKNPSAFNEFLGWLPNDTLLGITLESNRAFLDISKAPLPLARVTSFIKLGYPKMVSIEPIMDFDLDEMVSLMQKIKPEFVSIGADSGSNHLPEPSGGKVRLLIEELKEFTEVKTKSNLRRLLTR